MIQARKRSALILGFAFLAVTQLSQAASYDVDPSHSTVGFKIRHLVSKVTGKFSSFKGTYELDTKNLKTFKAQGTVDPATIDTGTAKRDEHLRSPDFFDVKKFPNMSFETTTVKDIKGNTAIVMGKLTMHGVTKEIPLKLEASPEAKDPWGGTRTGLTLTGKLNREDFGLKWNKALEAGSLLVGQEVELSIEIEGSQPAAKK